MLSGAKNYLRRRLRGARCAAHFPLLLPHHTLRDAALKSVDGTERPIEPMLGRILSFCDGRRTLAEVARQAGAARSEVIRAHEHGLLLFWRSAVPHGPAAAVNAGHSPHAIILSPHLDDAALSCGGRMLGDHSVLVVNVFSRAAWWRFGEQMRPDDVPRIQACRNAEEDLIARLSGAAVQALDLPEALLRGYAMGEIFSACPGAPDVEVSQRVRRAVTDLARQHPLAHWYLPLGVGEHIDHRIVRDAAAAALAESKLKGSHLHFYEDLPYAAKLGPDADFSKQVPGYTLAEEILEIEESIDWKMELLRAYWSQFRVSDLAELRRYAMAVGDDEAAEVVWNPVG